VEKLSKLAADRFYVIREGSGVLSSVPAASSAENR